MIGGLNHDLRHDGKIYHVQTEFFNTRGNRKIQTVVFSDGAVVGNMMRECTGDEATARKHIERAHKKAIKMILLGQLQSPPVKELLRPAKAPRVETVSVKLEETPQTLPPIKRPVSARPRTAEVTPIRPEVRIPDRIAQAREILVDLIGTTGFGGLGLFDRDGDLTTFISSSDIDLQVIGPDYLGLFLSAREINARNPNGMLHTLRFDSEKHTTLVLSFEPFLQELYEKLNGVMAYVLVQLDASLPMTDILSLVRHFMSLISEELLRFAPEAAAGESCVGPAASRPGT